MRLDKRDNNELRELSISVGFTQAPAGSVLIEAGGTRILCTASIVDQVPLWLKGSDSGWVTAEYAMLPGSTRTRKQRAGRGGRVDGRAQEIQRLIGRSMRAVTDLKAFPERAVWLDCDVLQADGGTRTLAISGAWIALHEAFKKMMNDKEGKRPRSWPLKSQVAAVSVGIVDGEALLDLAYREDSKADVDMNIVMNSQGDYVEIQGGAEKGTFSGTRLQELLSLADGGIESILKAQKEAVGKI